MGTHYQQIPSLRQIIYLESTKMFVTLYERADENQPWTSTGFSRPNDNFIVQGPPLSLTEIYRNMKF